jgi:hypothetical protein
MVCRDLYWSEDEQEWNPMGRLLNESVEKEYALDEIIPEFPPIIPPVSPPPGDEAP